MFVFSRLELILTEWEYCNPAFEKLSRGQHVLFHGKMQLTVGVDDVETTVTWRRRLWRV